MSQQPEKPPLGKGQVHLSSLWARRSELSGHASTHVRTSALAGLAVAWLFAGASEGNLSELATASTGLLLAAAVFAASLGADILHYYLGAEVFRSLARHYEVKNGASGDDPVKNPWWAPIVPAVFYNLKVIMLFVGYAILVVVFFRAI